MFVNGCHRNAIFSMGLVGSGTNNARLASMLRNLAQFYHKEPSDLFVVRLAQVSHIIYIHIPSDVIVTLILIAGSYSSWQRDADP